MGGFVYVMTNKGLRSGLVKIGKSIKDPTEERQYELHTTGVPEPFEVAYYAFVSDFSAVEARCHKLLDNKRPNPNREFFEVSVEDAITTIRKIAGADLLFERTYTIVDTQKCDSGLALASKKSDESSFTGLEIFGVVLILIFMLVVALPDSKSVGGFGLMLLWAPLVYFLFRKPPKKID